MPKIVTDDNHPTWRRVNTRIATDAYQLLRSEARRQAEILARHVTNGEVVTQALRAYLGAHGRALDPHILSENSNLR